MEHSNVASNNTSQRKVDWRLTYTPFFSQANLSVEDDIHFLSHYPLLPPFPLQEKWKVDFYIDATTSQIFDFYGFYCAII